MGSLAEVEAGAEGRPKARQAKILTRLCMTRTDSRNSCPLGKCQEAVGSGHAKVRERKSLVGPKISYQSFWEVQEVQARFHQALGQESPKVEEEVWGAMERGFGGLEETVEEGRQPVVWEYEGEPD